MDEEPELPEPLTTFKSTQWKRVRLRSPLASSSDPVFSSDDNPSAENYTGPREKKVYKGPWYAWYAERVLEGQGASKSRTSQQSRPGKRKLDRHFDSGVWMGSDSSTDDDAVLRCESSHQWQNLLKPSSDESSKLPPGPNPAELASQLVTRYIEESNEEIDLSAINLSKLPGETIRALDTLAPAPRCDPVSGLGYSEFVPLLSVNLAGNNLKTLPKELFELQTLTYLSLRKNELRELPAAIGICRLFNLNVAQNKLHHLPFEILKLFDTGYENITMQLHPNPYYVADNVMVESSRPASPSGSAFTGPSEQINGSTEIRPRRNRRIGHRRTSSWNLLYGYRSETRFLDIYGRRVKGPILPEDYEEGSPSTVHCLKAVSHHDIPEAPGPNPPSKAPSLMELALKACSKFPRPNELSYSLPPLHAPSLPKLLSLTAEMKECGGRTCNICKRDFIVPRTEWIEWWEFEHGSTQYGTNVTNRRDEPNRDVEERFHPLMRRGCSWKCVPEPVGQTIEDESSRELSESEVL